MFAVKAIMPSSGMVAVVKGGFRSHRDARRFMLKKACDGGLRVRFGMSLFVGGVE